ncbi:MAG: PQQ-binding-like beta-propeller repeat protein [Candidatus Acidiferrales bacterium]
MSGRGLRVFRAAALLLIASSSSAFAQGGPTQRELNDAASSAKNWLHPNHDYAGQRYVDLKQITPGNANSLHPVCLYQTKERVPTQTNPLEYDGTLYITTMHYTIALDATDCRLRWEHLWKAQGREVFRTNRGAAIKDGKIVRGTSDGFLIALNAQTGEQIWSKQIANPERGYFFSMPPLLYEDLILIGTAGSEWAAKGWVGAFRLKDGEPVWKFNTVPDPGEPGSETWGKDPEIIQHGGGSVWTPFSFDAEKGWVYVPVGNPSPDFFDEVRPGANLYTSSLVALDARTGKLEWYYQTNPHDVHDWDLPQVSPLFRTTVNGKSRNVVAISGKDGLLRLADRDTHEILYTVPFATRENVDVPLGDAVRVCPGALGGAEWSGPAYDPAGNTLFLPANDWCNIIKKDKEPPHFDAPLYLGGLPHFDPWEKARGRLTAFDASTGKERWRYDSPKPMLAGVTATSAGLLFTGEFSGDFLALDAATGKARYRFNTGGPVAGGVITYAALGKQYVAVMSGYVSEFFALGGGDQGGAPMVILFSLP